MLTTNICLCEEHVELLLHAYYSSSWRDIQGTVTIVLSLLVTNTI